MKTLLQKLAIRFILVLSLSFSLVVANAQTYTTRTSGTWTSPATWVNGLVPPDGLILATATININHNVTYNGLLDISNSGVFNIVNSTGSIPVFTVPTGKKFTNTAFGKLNIKNAEYRQYRFTAAGNTGTQQSGEMINDGGNVTIYNSIMEVAENITNKATGTFVFRKGILLTGKNFEVTGGNSIDTLDRVWTSIGWHNNGDFKLSNGKIYFNQAKIQIAGTTSKFNLNNGTATGDIDYITFKNNQTGVIGTGELKAASSIGTGTGLNLDAYNVSTGANFQPNAKFVGTQSSDATLNYFPSNFLIQQANNLSSGLSFSSPRAIGDSILTVGGKFRFSLVNDTTDAIVTIDSLIGNAKVTTIDDNTVGTGYIAAFQPKVQSGSIVGKSYAVFTVQFVKTGSTTPVSLQNINATPLDIDGGATLREMAEVGMGEGATMSWMSNSNDIALMPEPVGFFGAYNIAGIERDNIDTASYYNMFTVANSDVSSFVVKYGTITSSPSSSARQFSLYMRGFTYQRYALLPVKMKEFTAILAADSKVNLSWTTASEVNLENFVVERSIDGTNYSDVATVFAIGNSTTDQKYKMTDNVKNLASTIVYYRLRSVNNDGKFDYSDVRIIRLTKTSDITISTYPNPATSNVNITIPANWQNKKVVYELFAINGQTAQRIEKTNSNQTETISVANLNSGVYMIKVTCEGNSTQQKIVKQ